MNFLNYRKAITSILSNPLDQLILFIDEHPDQKMNSQRGKIIKETKFMIHLETDSERQISVSKRGGKFIISSNNYQIAVSGDLLIGSAKTRSKKKYRKW